MGTVSSRVNHIVQDIQRARDQTETHTGKQCLSNSAKLTELLSKEQWREHE
jgi:hypothetical protein